MKLITLLLLLVCHATLTAFSEVQPGCIFGDNAVLQQGVEIPVWGKARDGEVVSLNFQGQQKAVTAKDGKWMIHLKKLKSGGPFTMTISGDNKLVLTNILVGDVWLCSGQSNMEFGLGGAHNAKEAILQANLPELRIFLVNHSAAFTLQDTVIGSRSNQLQGSWQVCTPDNILKDGARPNYPGFSAVAYFFGREIQTNQSRPVGLIGCYWGGTRLESWMSMESLQSTPAFATEVTDYEASDARHRSNGVGIGEAEKNTPTVLFNAMINPLIPYAMKGVVWYQGEQNATTPHGYGALFKTMISDWRQRWHLGDFPFLFVQIASYHAPQTYPSEGGWAWLREEQLKALALPHTAMASAIDLGNPKDVHPRDKADVGHRLALAARHVAYGETLESSGPMYDSIEIKGNTIQISFQHVGGGLQIGIPPWTSELKPPVKLVRLTGFAIAGAERKWFFAEALIDGNRVYVSSEKVPNPVAVRYDWASFPLGNLYNAEGLPASPFRTDHWEEPINF